MMWYLTRCSSEPIMLRVSDVVNYILVVVMHNQMQGFSKQSSEEKKLHFCFNNNVYTYYVIISLDY